ncbi:MAG TPA: orotidine-5'-phosphate decarboxylase [Acidimicrobiales bacterium]|jgi:orotidine-5'-phosphate decarboxylase|nr:orotidine-5'-phosphate decarboxylase [Acidimicrobiales bacterium]
MDEMTGVSGVARELARERLALALDTDDLPGAVAIARRLQPWFGVAKVGLQLYTAAGPNACRALADEGLAVFLDLKLHDIPTTVGAAAAAANVAGATYLTTHVAGGEAGLRAVVSAFGEGAGSGGVFGVTVLTSQTDAPPELVGARAALAAAAGCVGFVCAATDLQTAVSSAPKLLAVVPGIRLAGSDVNDQRRVGTPFEAIAGGAGLLVLGRTVTHAADPEAAAEAVTDEVVRALNCQ